MTDQLFEAVNAIHGKISKLSPIALEELYIIRNIIKIVKYAEGDNFLTPGTSSQKIAFSLSGLAKTFYITEDGKEYITHFAAEGNFVGAYTDMLKNIPSTGYIQAIEPCVFLEMDYQELLMTTKESLAWAHLLRTIAQGRYIYLSDNIRNINRQSANERYQYFVETYPDLVTRLPQNQIALFLSVTPATLSRLKNGSGKYKK